MAQPPAPVLHPDIDVATAFVRIGRTALQHVLELVPQVRATGSVEAIHHLRVALRRLRTAMALFGKVVADAQTPVLRAELGAVARALGTVRDLDVLMATLPADAMDDVLASLANTRAAALADLRALLDAPAFGQLLHDLDRWIRQGAWQSTAPPIPLARFAARRLGKWARRLRHAPDDPGSLAPRRLHVLRIRAKKLRYAIEAVDGAFAHGHRARARFVKALVRLQDSLGQIHDMDAATSHAGLFDTAEPIAAAGMAARLEHTLAADTAHARRKQERRARKAMKRLKALPRWWRER